MIETLRRYNFWNNEPIECGLMRSLYLDILVDFLDTKLVKVLLGQRRSGKSYLLRMLIKHLISECEIAPSNILYINKDIGAFESIRNDLDLFNVIDLYKKEMKPEGKCYLFLDEIQEIKNWEKVINSLSQDYVNEYEIFITGSNSNLLSTELSTLLSGRYIKINVFPFSYSEFLKFRSLEKGKDSLLLYLKHGGIPETFNLKKDELISNYIESLKDSIILRDIVQRHSVRDTALLKRIIDFSIDSIGSLSSQNKITRTLKSFGYKTNVETLGAYYSYLVDAFFLHESPRFDLKGKKILSGEKKYYINDLAFKYFTASSFDFSIGRYLENLVYLHFKRKGYQIYTGKYDNYEIDFVVEKSDLRKYIQVCYLLSDDSVIEREFGNLEKINDNYEKIVVSLDDINLGNREGIRHINAWDLIE